MSLDIGYDAARFTEQVTTEISCGVCQAVVRNPVECINCGLLYCSGCIQIFQQKSNTCTNKCPPIKDQFQPIKGALLRYYKNLDIKCLNPNCQKVMKLSDIVDHEIKCLSTPCSNQQICKSTASKEEPLKSKQVCSQECLLTNNLWQQEDPKQMLKEIQEFFKSLGPVKQGSLKQECIESTSIINNGNKIMFKWDPTKAGTGISFYDDNTKVFLKESAYMFRTVIADTPMMSGCHYWEIHGDSRTENELKIGVCNSQSINFNSAFCDAPNGWAYYGLGQLRHNSNASGSSYGKRFKKEGVLGCYLNMNTGSLAFSLNGESMGIAFQNPALTKGPIYPAVALLHCAGCTIVSVKNIPAIFEKI